MDISILKDILIIFTLSTVVNFIFTKIRVPTIIGYLLTGVLAGPHLFSLISSVHEIELMAEIGIVLLMFTIGMEFSLKHLLRIRRIVFVGGFLQLLVTSGVTMLVAMAFQLSWGASLFVGFLVALSSTAVVLKVLQERSELSSNYGRTVLGILIFQDIILVPLLLFTPLLSGMRTDVGSDVLLLLVKAVLIIALVYLGNKWLMPKLLHAVAMTRNQELFLMSILLICLSVALFSSWLGLSLAFGAFLGGLMVSESEYSHQAFGNLIPFKDMFTSFFFVSIGMLLDLHFVVNHYVVVILTVLLVLILKFTVAGFTAFLLGHTFRGVIMVGVALSQVGEFSFILAKEGVDYGILSPYYYQLFLAVAVVTMSLSPFTLQMAHPVGEWLLKWPIPRFLVDGLFPLPQMEIPHLKNHMIVIGKDSRALSLSRMASHMKLPYVAIVFDPAVARQRQLIGETVIYGDAVNEPILRKAHIDTADLIVISIGDVITAMAVIDKVRQLNAHAKILVRTRYVDDLEELYHLGADQVIPEEFETAIELFQRVLKHYLIPDNEIRSTVAQIRDDHYGIFREKAEVFVPKQHDILNEIPNLEIIALKVEPISPLIGQSLAEVQFRRTFGVTLLALKRGEELHEHPPANITFLEGDIAYVLGKPEQIARAIELFAHAGAE
ncbi:monovalent cation:proton antiporter family protein [Prolixibacter sp. NT017]|uniref:monovalent cation:proton antiporter family protein n=1 Tax=Prolixibacter sp. NT017 TaxID=2652390 RepID=UPI00127D0788|nr:monovalent cation:proton antiporter family protein [Prolixibacter sp. NT017]GET25971.1 potassium transporter KefB [Prolixibacter sp. NT017]